MLVALSTEANQPGALHLDAAVGGRVWRRVLEPDEIQEREALCAAVRRLQEDHDLSSYWISPLPGYDRRLAQFDHAYHDLHAWDLRTLVGPLLDILGDAAPAGQWLVLCEGQSALPYFNPRGALRVGVLRGLTDSALLQRTCVLHSWAGRGCVRLAELATARTLPLVDPRKLDILVAPPPNELDDRVRRLAAASPGQDVERLLADDAERDPAPLQGIVSRRDWQALLCAELTAAAKLCGASVTFSATAGDLQRCLTSGHMDRSLVLVAHQDGAGGIHLADGRVPLAALAAFLLALREGGSAAHGSVDLGVCEAEQAGNLAECFQSFGVPVVHTHGSRAHFGRVLGTWIWALRLLASERVTLPALLDRSWLRWLAKMRIP